MNVKNKMTVEFVMSLVNSPQKTYEEAKVTLLAVEAGNEHMTEFLTKAFSIAEEYRPKLLEMKGGTAV